MKTLLAATAFTLSAVNAHSLGAQTITVAPSACQALTAHTPADDAAYRPGVDVIGNTVAPADLNASGQLNLGVITNFGCPSNCRSRMS